MRLNGTGARMAVATSAHLFGVVRLNGSFQAIFDLESPSLDPRLGLNGISFAHGLI